MKLISKFVVAATLLSTGIALAQQQNDKIDLPLLGMQISEQEKQAIEASIGYAREISKRAEAINGLPYRRDAHAKATGCVRATFSVNGDIPAHFQHGEPGVHRMSR